MNISSKFLWWIPQNMSVLNVSTHTHSKGHKKQTSWPLAILLLCLVLLNLTYFQPKYPSSFTKALNNVIEVVMQMPKGCHWYTYSIINKHGDEDDDGKNGSKMLPSRTKTLLLELENFAEVHYRICPHKRVVIQAPNLWWFSYMKMFWHVSIM